MENLQSFESLCFRLEYIMTSSDHQIRSSKHQMRSEYQKFRLSRNGEVVLDSVAVLSVSPGIWSELLLSASTLLEHRPLRSQSQRQRPPSPSPPRWPEVSGCRLPALRKDHVSKEKTSAKSQDQHVELVNVADRQEGRRK